MCSEVPAAITGHHDPDSQEVVLSHLLLRDHPDRDPLGAQPALQLLLLHGALGLLGGRGLVSHGQPAAWGGTKGQQAVSRDRGSVRHLTSVLQCSC